MIKQTLFRAASIARLDHMLLRKHRGELKVLMYHNVERGPRHLFANSIAATEFARHLDWLKAQCNLVRIDPHGNISGMHADRVNVLLSFDDGFANNAEVVAPMLSEAGLGAVFFVIANCVGAGTVPAFQRARLAAGKSDTPSRTMTAADLRDLQALGMTIGSHSLDHTDHRLLNDDQLAVDATTSRKVLEDVLGTPVGCFAFPWGHHRAGQPERMQDFYDKVFLTRHGFADATDQILPRNEVADRNHLPHAVAGTIDLFRSESVPPS